MYSIVIGLSLIHLLMLFILLIFNKIDINIKYNKKTEEYKICKMPKSEFISLVIYYILICFLILL